MMSTQMPFPKGKKSLHFGGWEKRQKELALVGPWPSHHATSLLYLRVSVSMEGAHAVPCGSRHHHGEQLSLMHQRFLEFLLCAGLQELLAEGDV